MSSPLGELIYTGFSYVLSFGIPEIPAGFSGYLGYSGFLFDTKTRKQNLKP